MEGMAGKGPADTIVHRPLPMTKKSSARFLCARVRDQSEALCQAPFHERKGA